MCKGLGSVRKPGNPHVSAQLLEIAGLIGNRAAPPQPAPAYSSMGDFARLNRITIDID